jgi:tetratricopeptide (TPR) repeat protein
MGDIFLKIGNLETTEQYYQKALEVDPLNKDVLYDMGKLHRERKEWEKAFDYLEKAYIRDPAYWGPAAVVLIPDTLMKMGRHDEALEWCERILKDRQKSKRIVRAITKKRDEVKRLINQNKK